MMKARELRIGNYVNYTPDYLTTIPEELLIDEGEFIMILDGRNQAVEPIILTEEWLLKMGFESKIYNMKFKKNGIEIINKMVHEKEFNFLYFKKLGVVRLDYVHQLQNLYFALTGEELELK